jgi:hypothetical protein
MPDTRKAALKYAEYNWQIFPLAVESKEPLTPNGYKNATVDAQSIITMRAAPLLMTC